MLPWTVAAMPTEFNGESCACLRLKAMEDALPPRAADFGGAPAVRSIVAVGSPTTKLFFAAQIRRWKIDLLLLICSMMLSIRLKMGCYDLPPWPNPEPAEFWCRSDETVGAGLAFEDATVVDGSPVVDGFF
ncbi:hypothetical protein ACLOJK_040233 [Asimina triloba]